MGRGDADYTVRIVDEAGEEDMSVAVVGDQVVDLTGATPGDVLTVQSDGTVAPEPVTDSIPSGTYVDYSEGLFSARPAAASVPNKSLYLATDVNGGTLYRSNGSAWANVAAYGPTFPTELATIAALVVEADGITGLNDGDTIPTWPAAFGTAPTQATAGSRPTYKIVDGLPAVLFASGKYMQAATGAPSSGFEMVAVARQTNVSPQYQWIGGFGEEATGKRRLLGFVTPSGGDRGEVSYNGFSADLTGGRLRSANQSDFYVASVSRASGTISLRRDGEPAVTATPTLNSYVSTIVTLGANNAGTENLVGYVRGFYLFTRELTAYERRLLGEYLVRKWGATYARGRVSASAEGTAGGHRFYSANSGTGADDNGVISQNVNSANVSHFVAMAYDKGLPGNKARGEANGYGNSAGAPFSDCSYLEAFELDTTVAPPALLLVQTGLQGGSWAIRKRVEITSTNGDVIVYDRAGNAKLKVLGNGGGVVILSTAAPADADLAANEMALWLDPTNGTSKLMIKAKSANGTVVTGLVALV